MAQSQQHDTHRNWILWAAGCALSLTVIYGLVGTYWFFSGPPSPSTAPPANLLVSRSADLAEGMQRTDEPLPETHTSPVIAHRSGNVYLADTPYRVTVFPPDASSPARAVHLGTDPVLQLALSHDESTLYVLDAQGIIHRQRLNHQEDDPGQIRTAGASILVPLDADRVCWRDIDNQWYMARPGDTPKPLSGIEGLVGAASQGGLAVVTRTLGSSAEVIDLFSGQAYGTVSLQEGQRPIALDATPDRSTMVLGLNDGTVVHLDGTRVTSTTKVGVTHRAMRVLVDAKGHAMAVAADELALIDAETMEIHASVSARQMPSRPIMGLRWLPQSHTFSVLTAQGVTTWQP
ncbi:MAG: hypothetical protein AAF797_00900 [Planctomycetota bacterium]